MATEQTDREDLFDSDINKDESLLIASQAQLIWWRFRKHRVALVCTIILASMYILVLFPEFFAIHDPTIENTKRSYTPPQGIHFFDGWKPVRPYVYGLKSERNPETYALEHTADKEVKYDIIFFAKSYEYETWNLFRGDRHLFGLRAPPDVQWAHLSGTRAETMTLQGERVPFHPLGTDMMGRDMFSRIIYGTRVSMSIGLVGVAISFFLGILFGGISGFSSGFTDNFIQRMIEFFRSIPTLPLWIGLSAVLPRDWSVVKMYFAITVIISLIGWTTLAREVRGRFLSMRQEDFVTAAVLYGTKRLRVIFRHMVPSFISHIIAVLTLSIPSIIIAETSLSFLGIGMRTPAISWGVLLSDAQQLRTVASAPWLMIPGGIVILVVLCFNFMGDGIRDAADPYSDAGGE